MSGKWTPGPWFAIKMCGWGGTVISRRNQNDADRIAGDCPVAKVSEGASHWATKYPHEANARLIAAAPDLAEALEGCLNYLENTEAEFGVILSSADKARAALAKAKGEAA